MKGFGDSKPGSGSRSVYMKDIVDMVDWPEGEYLRVRMVGPVFSVLNVWFPIKTKKGNMNVGKMSLDFNGEKDEIDNDICPYRQSGKGNESKSYYVNVIVRDYQEGKTFPKPKTELRTVMDYEAYWAVKGDTKKTPVRVLQINETTATKLQDLAKLNRVKNKKTGAMKNYELSDPKYGCDIEIKKTKTKGAPIYDVQKAERTPLTDEEMDYLLYQMNLLKPLSVKAAKADMERMLPMIIEKDKKSKSRDDSDDDDDRPSRNKSSKKKSRDEDAEDEVVNMNDDDDDDDEDNSSKKKKQSLKKKSRDDDDDEDDEDLDDDDEDDDDDRPSRNKSSKKKSRDEDAEDSDDDDEDNSSKKKKQSLKKKSRDDDDDEDDDDDLDDDLDDDDEDDEDDRPSKNKSKARRR